MANVTLDVYRKYLYPEDYAKDLNKSILLHATFVESDVVYKVPKLAKDFALIAIRNDKHRNFEEYEFENPGSRDGEWHWDMEEPDEEGFIRCKHDYIISATHSKRGDNRLYIVCYEIEIRYKQPKG